MARPALVSGVRVPATQRTAALRPSEWTPMVVKLYQDCAKAWPRAPAGAPVYASRILVVLFFLALMYHFCLWRTAASLCAADFWLFDCHLDHFAECLWSECNLTAEGTGPDLTRWIESRVPGLSSVQKLILRTFFLVFSRLSAFKDLDQRSIVKRDLVVPLSPTTTILDA